MNIEHLAVNEIDELISRTDLLNPAFNKDEKGPSWDGFIYTYKNKQKQKDQMIGRAPVQIKGTTVNPQKKSGTKYRVNYSDISNYRDDGGALYFVVYINSTQQKEVFYSALLPYTLNELLENNKGKNTFSLTLQKFPTKAKDIENIVINFVQNCQRQSSPSRENWTLEKLAENFNLKQPKITYHFTDVYKYKDPMDYLFNHFAEMYVPVALTNQEYPIGSARLEVVQREEPKPVTVAGKQYYSSFKIRRDKDGTTLFVGGDLMSFLMTENKSTFNFKLAGSLSEQIHQIDFILDITDSHTISFGEVTYDIGVESITEKEREKIEDLRKKQEWNKDLQLALKTLGINKELSFDNWQDRDSFYASQIVKAIVYNEPVKLPDTLNVMSILNIGNIGVGVICEKLSSGLYRVRNMFDNELDIFITLDGDGDTIDVPTSQFVILKKENIQQISNMNYDVITKSIKRFHSTEHYDAVNRLVLEMLSAYDESLDSEILKATIKITRWLYQESTEDIYLLNWYQSVYRKNKKDKRIDRSKIEFIIRHTDRVDVMAGAAILLEDYDSAAKCLSEMSKEMREEFLKYPIAKLMPRLVTQDNKE